jgi:uncharacterized membrane protein YraQ (UPF0718 family)
MDRRKEAISKAGRALYTNIPIFLGIILLIGLVNAMIPKSAIAALFSNNIVLDPFIGSILGSIFIGNPVTSYILGGEFLAQGVSLLAVTAFMVSWVTVGFVQLPAEALMLGKRFAILRKITGLVLAVFVAITTIIIMGLI